MFGIMPAGPHSSAMPAAGHAVPARRHGTVPRHGLRQTLGMPHSKSDYNLRKQMSGRPPSVSHTGANLKH